MSNDKKTTVSTVDFLSSAKKSFGKFSSNGVHVDLEAYFSTPGGEQDFNQIIESAKKYEKRIKESAK